MGKAISNLSSVRAARRVGRLHELTQALEVLHEPGSHLVATARGDLVATVDGCVGESP